MKYKSIVEAKKMLIIVLTKINSKFNKMSIKEKMMAHKIWLQITISIKLMKR